MGEAALMFMPGVHIPSSLSKSKAKALGCERYFAYTHCDETLPPQAAGEAAEVGSAFHTWRAAYVDWLVKTGQPADPGYAEMWLSNQAVKDEVRGMIEWDSRTFQIDPEAVFGTEVFMSVDDDFRPLHIETGCGGGRGARDSRAIAHGIVDLLEVRGDIARAIDWKTGFTVDAQEAEHYAALIFAHFPYVNEVSWEWDLVRTGEKRPILFTRETLNLIQSKLRGLYRQMKAVAVRFADGQEMTVNPQSELCPYCNLTCPLREAVARKVIEFPPLQTDDDARKVAALIYVAEETAKRGRQVLRPFLEKTGQPLDLGKGYVAEMRPTTSTTFPLRPTLRALGVDVPESSVSWDVPLDSLTIGTTQLKSYGKAKKRDGMLESLAGVAVVKESSELSIHKA